MRRYRILIITHEALVPADLKDLPGMDDSITEYHVYSTLLALGHHVRMLGIGDQLTELRETIRDWRPHVVFNLMEQFAGIVSYDYYVVAFLELMRQRYTGCGPRGLMLSRDKVLTKQVLAWHRVPTAAFQFMPFGKRFREPRRLRFPLFVKSATDDASLGIAQASLVDDMQSLKERVEFIHEQVQSDALVEEYIEGRELYVGVMGNAQLTTFPPWEMNFGSLPRAGHRDTQGQVGPQISAKTRHHDRCRAGSESRADGTTESPREARLSRAAHERFRAHGLSHAARRRRVLARGKRKPEPDARRGSGRVGQDRRRQLRSAVEANRQSRARVYAGVADVRGLTYFEDLRDILQSVPRIVAVIDALRWLDVVEEPPVVHGLTSGCDRRDQVPCARRVGPRIRRAPGGFPDIAQRKLRFCRHASHGCGVVEQRMTDAPVAPVQNRQTVRVSRTLPEW